MGAWGREPFENDSALDFVGDLKRVPRRRRLHRVRAALESYLAFDADPQKFEPRDIDRGELAKALRAVVRHSVSQAKKNGSPVPAQVAKFVGKSTDALIATLTIKAPIYDRAHEVLTAIAAAELLLSRLTTEHMGEGRILTTVPRSSVRLLLPLARR